MARAGGTVIIDTAEAEFIDLRGLLVLDRHAARTGATTVSRSAPAIVTRVPELVDVVAARVDGGP